MQPKSVFFILTLVFSVAVAAQGPAVLPLSSEPHHHLALHNEYVNVYHVEVKPQDSVLLHRHDVDAISVMLDDAQVVVHAPGKPEAPQKLTGAQVRLQPRGYVHSTLVVGDRVYRNVTVELLVPQENERNLCAPVIAGQALDCPKPPAASPDARQIDEPQFETDQTTVTLTRVVAHRGTSQGSASQAQLIVALDDAVVASARNNRAEQVLHPGDFVWLDAGGAPRSLRNDSDKEARYVSFSMKPAMPHTAQSTP